VRFGAIIENIRDRLVRRSLVGKRKLDRTATRRALDLALRELGERYRGLVRTGRIEVPAELTAPMQQVRLLEDRLDAHQREITALEDEQPSTT
jgi:hypothetical protein